MNPCILGVLMACRFGFWAVLGTASLIVSPLAAAQVKMPIELVDFGVDGVRGNNGDCEDARFTGPAVETVWQAEEDNFQDATDCRLAYEAGGVWILAAEPPEDETSFSNPFGVTDEEADEDIDFLVDALFGEE